MYCVVQDLEQYLRQPYERRVNSRTSDPRPAPSGAKLNYGNQSKGQSSTPSNIKESIDKGVAGESSKWTNLTRCYNYHKVGQMACECPTKNPQLYLEGTEGNTDDLPVDEYVLPNDEEDKHDENRLSLLRFIPYK